MPGVVNGVGADEVAADVELLEDSRWKRIQQNTFTRWANEHLRKVGLSLADLESDLSDGTLLVRLIEVLAGEHLPRYNRLPKFRSQKLENVSVALNYLECHNIRLVNIDSSDIVDGRLKLILGLIWTLILHYSISIPVWDGEAASGQNAADTETPKQRLLGWVRAKIPGVAVSNFTSDWNDGRAIGALVDAVSPGLNPDWPDWDPKDALENTSEAMNLAKTYLAVPKLIEPNEMIDPNVDEFSVMTYLSQYPSARPSADAPVRRRGEGRVPPSPVSPTAERIYGDGLSSATVGQPATFYVEHSRGGPCHLDVEIRDAAGAAVSSTTSNYVEKERLFTVSYMPTTAGWHNIRLKLNGVEVGGSPFAARVRAPPLDLNKVRTDGPGLHSGVVVGRPTFFNVRTADAGGEGVVEAGVLTPSGQRLPVKLTRTTDGTRVDYEPTEVGAHSVNVFADNQTVAGSPFGVRVVAADRPERVRVLGRGVQPTGVRVGDVAKFRVFLAGQKAHKLQARVTAPDGTRLPLREYRTDEEDTVHFDYEPTATGDHKVEVLFADSNVPRSPFAVNVDKKTEKTVKAFGPGLEGGVCNLPCDFTVDTNGNRGTLGFAIEGPSKTDISCGDNKDGSAEISYTPTAEGEYAVHVLCDNEDIKDSPFMVVAHAYDEHVRPSYVRCSGPGLAATGLKKGLPTQFQVDTLEAGHAHLKAVVLDNDFQAADIATRQVGTGVYQCAYTPTKRGRQVVWVSYGEVGVPGSPFRCKVDEQLDVAKVRLHGPGVGEGVKNRAATSFLVNCADAGAGDLELSMLDNAGAPVELDVMDNHDETFTVRYTPQLPGDYELRAFYGGIEIDDSPRAVRVLPHVDTSVITVSGIPNEAFVGSRVSALVDARRLSADCADGLSGHLTCSIAEPQSERALNCPVVDRADGTATVVFMPKREGEHAFRLFYDSIELTGAPLSFVAVAGADASKCTAYGDGLSRAAVGEKAEFRVDSKDAGRGGLNLLIRGPEEVKATCRDDDEDGVCVVEYVPETPGFYSIDIQFADAPIPGSPFKAVVGGSAAARRVFAFGEGIEQAAVSAGQPLSFVVDASHAGEAELSVMMVQDGSAVEPLYQPVVRELPRVAGQLGGPRFEVSYLPPHQGGTVELRIKYGACDVPNTPRVISVLPSHLSGSSVVPLGEIPASVPYTFDLNSINCRYDDLQVLVTGPDDEPCHVNVLDRTDGTYRVTFTPEDTGPYKIQLSYSGDASEMLGCLLSVATGDASKCRITERPPERVDLSSNVRIVVDASLAGDGRVTGRVQPQLSGAKPLSLNVTPANNGLVAIDFKPTLVAPHRITIKFGGIPIPDGDWIISVVRSGNGEYSPAVRQPLTWRWSLPEHIGGNQLTASVTMPSKKAAAPTINENADGSVSVKYEPVECGLHEMHVKHNGIHVQGSPFQFHVDHLSDHYVTAFGSGLVYGIAGEPAAFTIVASESAGHSILGHGGLSVSVEGPAKAEIKCHDNKDGTCSVTWIPPAPGEYRIHVRHSDKDISGSPFAARVAGEGRKRAHLSVGSTSEVALNIAEDLKGLSASIKSPSGIEEPCFIRKLDDSHLGVSFTPREVGEHLVSVKKRGTLLPAAPFRINVSQKEVGNAGKVQTTGPGLQQAQTQQFNEFHVDTRHAGFGGLSVSLEGPSKAEIQCKDNKDGTCAILYKPTEPGIYVLGVKFADHHVSGSPFTVKCQGAGVGTVGTELQKHRTQASTVAPGQDCELYFRLPNTSPLEMTAKILDPEGNGEDIELRELSEGQYLIHFQPQMAGLHAISVLDKLQHVAGSPFQFTVGTFKEGGAHKVRAGGIGLVRGEVNLPSIFNIYSRESGTGDLIVNIEGPSKASVEYRDQKDGNGYVLWSASKSGEYVVSVKFDDRHIPDSPFKVYVSPSTGEARKLEVAAFPDTGLQMNKPVTFTVLTRGAKGHLDAKVVTPSGATDDCFLTPIDEGESYAVRFIPREVGNHYVQITLDGAHMRDSPFRVRVGGTQESDPTAVNASGGGLKEGETGQKLEFIVNTCNAGGGDLQVTVDGPSKVTLDAYEVELGYKVRYTPLAPGDYLLAIKYNGVHIPGSPFKVLVSGKVLGGSGYNESSTVKVEAITKSAKSMARIPKFKGDASKVECKGMGLKKAYAGRQTHFTVDASKAGQDLLYVQVVTPKGPSDEVYVKHQGRGQYAVNYKLSERGKSHIFVKYGDEHIPGSPFEIDV